jgi:hypothetical protein
MIGRRFPIPTAHVVMVLANEGFVRLNLVNLLSKRQQRRGENQRKERDLHHPRSLSGECPVASCIALFYRRRRSIAFKTSWAAWRSEG